MIDRGEPTKARAEQLDTLIAAIGTADAETLFALRQFLLDGMFPSMPESVRDVVLPVFTLATLEARAIEQGLPRLGEQKT
jgi:hypothetical protein